MAAEKQSPKELGNTGIQVHELILGPMKTRDRLKHGHGKPDWYLGEKTSVDTGQKAS
jgi:hypothetical protein